MSDNTPTVMEKGKERVGDGETNGSDGTTNDTFGKLFGGGGWGRGPVVYVCENINSGELSLSSLGARKGY